MGMGGAAAAEEEEEEKRVGSQEKCQFWLPKKKRFCANAPLPHSSYCGNHSQRSDAQWIPCPLDPSHSVLQDNLEGHLKRCPLLKQSQSLQTQPFYQKGINADDNEQEHTSSSSSSSSSSSFTSEMKRNAVYAMTPSHFYELIRKIKSIHHSLCKDNIQDSYKVPEACSIWINREVDRKLPFQEKHVAQQASILGNLEEFGVLRSSSVTKQDYMDRPPEHGDNVYPAVVEFGAGRGYLTQMLADCYGINKVFLVERKSYKLKADRSLRQKESLVLERLRIDIEDLNLNAVESLQGVPFLAIGKHLCGPATDLTLRCCLRVPFTKDEVVKQSAGSCLRGLAIATCCHHLCQWKYYINKKFLSNLGITKEYFHAITWFTSWAVDADHGSDISDIMHLGLQVPSTEKDKLNAEVTTVEEIVRSMEATERAVLGFMCKEIIDVGRLMWLKEHGLKTRLVKYVPTSISPENRLLVAMQDSAL